MDQERFTEENVQQRAHKMEEEYEAMVRQEKSIRNMEEEAENFLQKDFEELEKQRADCTSDDKMQLGWLDERQELLEKIREERTTFMDSFHQLVKKKKQENSNELESLYDKIRRQQEQGQE
ncbi:MAG: hypothetical protein PHW34_08475 [Hespellia sp.]|nr:hypothetical protein [Hespellia sp.]